MSYTLLKADIKFYQRLLKVSGFYHDKIDGKWGKNTTTADDAFLQRGREIRNQYGEFHTRSEENIITLLPEAQIKIRQFLRIATDMGKDVRVLSGTRTYAQQDQLYRQGRRGKKGEKKVTNARGGQSNHNFGIAWDIGLFEDGEYVLQDAKYKALAEAVLPDLDGLEWGGHWKTFKDFPHYQLKAISDSVAVISKYFERGEVFV